MLLGVLGIAQYELGIGREHICAVPVTEFQVSLHIKDVKSLGCQHRHLCPEDKGLGLRLHPDRSPTLLHKDISMQSRLNGKGYNCGITQLVFQWLKLRLG